MIYSLTPLAMQLSIFVIFSSVRALSTSHCFLIASLLLPTHGLRIFSSALLSIDNGHHGHTSLHLSIHNRHAVRQVLHNTEDPALNLLLSRWDHRN